MFYYKEGYDLFYGKDTGDQLTVCWLDRQETSIFRQLIFVFSLLRAGFSVLNRNARITLFTIAMEQLSVSEQFALLVYAMHGEQMQKMEESTVSINTRIKEQSFGRDIACDPQLYNELLWDSARQVEMIAALFQEGSETGTKSVVIAQLKNLYRQEKAILCAIKRLLENECPMEEKFCLHSDILRNVSNSDDKCVPQFFSKRDIELEPFEN